MFVDVSRARARLRGAAEGGRCGEMKVASLWTKGLPVKCNWRLAAGRRLPTPPTNINKLQTFLLTCRSATFPTTAALLYGGLTSVCERTGGRNRLIIAAT